MERFVHIAVEAIVKLLKKRYNRNMAHVRLMKMSMSNKVRWSYPERKKRRSKENEAQRKRHGRTVKEFIANLVAAPTSLTVIVCPDLGAF